MKIDINEILLEFRDLPRFDDGRINYKNSKRALVINCFVKHKDKVLLLKRSDKVGAYKNKWNSVGGYLDEPKKIENKVAEELFEELGIKEDIIKEIIVKEPIEIVDNDINKIWITFPVLAELRNKPEIQLDWEHTEYQWVKPEEINYFDIIKDLDKIVTILIP